MRHNGIVLSGLDLIRDALRVEDFPMTREDLDYAIGDVEVSDTHGKWMPVRRVLDVVPQRKFHSVQEVIDAIQGHVEQVKQKHTHEDEGAA